MLKFSQAIAPQAAVAGSLGTKTALDIGKGFDQDQIAKLQDTCGVCNAQQIRSIWAVIQASRGKSFDTYHAHLAKSVDSWCQSHHIEHNKSNFPDSNFFEDLVALHFNRGGPVAQYTLAAGVMLMLVCRSSTAVEAKYRWEYKEAASHTRNTCSIDKPIKENHGKIAAPASNYMNIKLNIGTYCGLLWSILGTTVIISRSY